MWQASNPINKQSVAPITFIPPLCQWAHLDRPYSLTVIILLQSSQLCKTDFFLPVAYIPPSSIKKARQHGRNFQLYLSTFCDQSLWCLQQQGLLMELYLGDQEQQQWPALLRGHFNLHDQQLLGGIPCLTVFSIVQ